MSPRVSFFLLAIFILSMHAPTDYSPVSNAQANSNCDNGEFKPTEWNESVERLAKIPTVFDMDNDYSVFIVQYSIFNIQYPIFSMQTHPNRDVLNLGRYYNAPWKSHIQSNPSQPNQLHVNQIQANPIKAISVSTIQIQSNPVTSNQIQGIRSNLATCAR